MARGGNGDLTAQSAEIGDVRQIGGNSNALRAYIQDSKENNNYYRNQSNHTHRTLVILPQKYIIFIKQQK